MSDPFISVEYEGDQLLIARSGIMYARFKRPTDAKPARAILTLFGKGFVPHPTVPKSVAMLNTRYEFEGAVAETVWSQLSQPGNGVSSPA